MRTSIFTGALVLLAAGPALAADPTGDWRTANGWAHIRIVDCGRALWGVVAWESKPGGRDEQNPDPKLRSRPLLGAPILMDMRPNSDRWVGHVYNSQNGSTYDANIKLVGPDALRIEGCVLGGLFCGGEQWTRIAPTTQGKGGSKAAPKGSGPLGDVCSRVSNLSGRPH